nr:immunoglobulin light chain junction region [Macaca mulatta]
CQQYNSLPLIF